ncbi:hypothetical protein M0R45_005178 [Rubus argutus]|uniref:Glycoside hydrolase family 5 domain-containing protein n=1 Tax=Rubus argutus TaxID=59490 RepID=A0AAW1YM06_RUBAR
MSSNGLNSVRIPVGWWIAYDPTPPTPFVGGSLQALDNAFTWAQKYGMKVIIDLHAVQGSQNGLDHSATRDGYLEWGDSNIQDTLKVIDFLAARYSKNPALGAIELLNEPWAPGVTLDTLKKYYRAGYDAVRNHSPNVHFYSVYEPEFDKFNVEENIQYIHKQRASSLSTMKASNGLPLTFVGEWVAEFKQPPTGSSSEDNYRRFAKAQIEVYGNATFGWAYWSYRCSQPHWSLRHMIDSGIINLRK